MGCVDFQFHLVAYRDTWHAVPDGGVGGAEGSQGQQHQGEQNCSSDLFHGIYVTPLYLCLFGFYTFQLRLFFNKHSTIVSIAQLP